MTREEIDSVEKHVNEAILKDYPVTTEIMSVPEAKSKGAMALFDEKYGDAVRVVEIGDHSIELCGGTHLQRSSQAAYFRITSEQSVGSGIRRVEAVTGRAAMQLAHEDELVLRALSDTLKSPQAELLQRIDNMQAETRELEQKLRKLEQAQNADEASNLEDDALTVGEAKVLMSEVDVSSMEALREMAEMLRDDLAPAVVLLGKQDEGKAQFVCTVSQELVKAGIKAGDLVKVAAKVTGGGGGGDLIWRKLVVKMPKNWLKP